MMTESELKDRKHAARNGFLVWQLKPILVLVFLIVLEVAFAALATKPFSLGDSFFFSVMFVFAFWIAVRLADRHQLVRGLYDVWGALHSQKPESPPSNDLLFGLDELRGALAIYVRASRGYYSVSDLHIPRLRRQVNLAFAVITELLHRSVWKPSDIFSGDAKLTLSQPQASSPYDFLLSWTDEISRHILGSREKLRLFQNRILALSYFFDDTMVFFQKRYKQLVDSCGELITEASLRSQERRQGIVKLSRDFFIAVIGILIAGGLKFLTG